LTKVAKVLLRKLSKVAELIRSERLLTERVLTERGLAERVGLAVRVELSEAKRGELLLIEGLRREALIELRELIELVAELAEAALVKDRHEVVVAEQVLLAKR
jgi:hypothetical protein